jgi:membrane-bound serine protease (ClpP class)
MVGERGVVRRRLDPEGQILVHGELWRARGDEVLEPGDRVEVVAVDGLTVEVRRS